jgi:integrase
VLSRALKVAVQRNIVARNVCTLIDPPSVRRREVEPLAQADAKAILKAARDRPNAARWSVALALGLRQGEALGLQCGTWTWRPGRSGWPGSYNGWPGSTGVPIPRSAGWSVR